MVNIKNTLDELKDILTTIKTKQDANTAWTGTEKADIEKRINHVYDKSRPRHTNLTQDLDIDLTGIEDINKLIGDEKLRTDAEIKKLGDEKTKLQTDITAKDALIKQKNEEIGDKLTADLIIKLDALSKGVDKDGKIKIDETTLTNIKTVVEEIKTKGAKADLSTTNAKLDEIKNQVQKEKNQDNTIKYCAIGALITGIISLLFTGYSAFLKPSASPKIISQEKENDDSE